MIGADGQPAPEPVSEAIAALRDLVAEERERSAELERQVRAAAEAAAMWQERARNLEAELQRALALPAHEDPEPRRRWWQWWRRG